MRSLLVCVVTFFAVQVHAAPAKDCAELAVSFRDDLVAMEAASLARLRACTAGAGWSTQAAKKGSDPTPPSLSGPVVLSSLSKECQVLADKVAQKGLKPLPSDQRTRYRSCIDGAITSISSKSRPGNTANMPTHKIPDGRV